MLILTFLVALCGLLNVGAFRQASKLHGLRWTSPLKQTLKPYITKLIERQDLTISETENAWDMILAEAEPAAVGALLTLLRSKGETPQEIAGAVRSMKKACRPIHYDGSLLDIVGTGGDGADTINISTASVILAAASGCKVAKAGNRSVSSRCGSADVLETLGINLELGPVDVLRVLDDCGIGFMFAPIYHPAVKTVAPIRKALGVRTAFNLLGPLTNAAGADRVVLGVFDEELVSLLGEALVELGTIEHGVVIHGVGLDEISPLGPSTIFEIKNTAAPRQSKKYTTSRYQFDPQSVGIPRCTILDLKGGGPEENAQALRDVLRGGKHTDAKRDAIVLNAGMGNYVYGLAPSIAEGMALARKTLEAGLAEEKLQQWIAASQRCDVHK